MLVFMKNSYRAIVSSDWNECLAPCGPFDYITFTYPELKPDLKDIFKRYTGNRTSLRHAMQQVRALLPDPISIKQMDAYLDTVFQMYAGVANLMAWCHSQKILFMINTTGAIGYFQRAICKKLLPNVPGISAYPDPFFSKEASDPDQIYSLFDISDKARHTESVAQKARVPLNCVIVMGDSGGDGPHFKWGAANGAFLIASMAKPSLRHFCISESEAIDHSSEMGYDFMGLSRLIEDVAKRNN
jgi:hypothetical protein